MLLKKSLTTIHEILNQNALSDTVAFIGRDTSITRARFYADIKSHALHFASITSPDVVLYIPDDIYKFSVYFFALLFSNHDIILPSILTGKNLPSLSNLPLITNKSDELSSFGHHVSPGPHLDTTPPADTPIDISNCKISFFTSGSTGTPKQITKTFQMLSDEVLFHTSRMGPQLSNHPTLVASIAPHHMYGLLWRFLFPLYSGIPLDMDMIFTPDELISKQHTYPNIFLVTTPSFLDGITKYSDQYSFMQNTSAIITSGSMLSPATSTGAHKIFGTSPIEIYGSTETGGIASRQQCNGPAWDIFPPVHVDTDPTSQTVVSSPFSYKNPHTISDIIERVDDGHFILHGRTDRIVKIAEERISLPEMEEHLNTHPYISASYLHPTCRNTRTTVSAIISLTPAGREHIISVGRSAFISEIRQHLAQIVPAVALPRKFRILHALPITPQGKILKSDIISVLSNRLAEPVIQNLTHTPDTITADLTFLSESEYFRGHFPGYPILPGVIQLHFALRFIRMFFNTSHTDKYTITKLKFSALILPDSTVKFALTRHDAHTFSFEYTRDGMRCSAGRITFQDTPNV